VVTARDPIDPLPFLDRGCFHSIMRRQLQRRCGRAVALSGDLKDFGLLQLLTLVQVTQKTGALTLHRDGESATVYFQDGRMIRVEPPAARSMVLTEHLHRAGRIDKDTLEEITSQNPPSEQAVGLLLEDQGVLSREEIEEFVRERGLSDLFYLLTWPDGSFRFDVDAFPPEGEILYPTELGPVLERGRSYLDEWQLLTSYIPSLDRPLRLLAEPRQPMKEVRMGLDEWRMIASLAGNTPLKEVAVKLGLDEFGVRRVAYRLIESGLADVAEAEIVPPPLKEPSTAKEPEESKAGPLARLFGFK